MHVRSGGEYIGSSTCSRPPPSLPLLFLALMVSHLYAVRLKPASTPVCLLCRRRVVSGEVFRLPKMSTLFVWFFVSVLGHTDWILGCDAYFLGFVVLRMIDVCSF